jgi:hypothetical protein
MIRRLLAIVAFLQLWTISSFAQLAPPVDLTFLNAAGTGPAANGFVCTTISGGTTSLLTYQDQALTTPNQNPIRLNAAGRPVNGSNLVSVFLQQQTYRFTVYAAGTGNTCNGTTVGALIKQVDGVVGTPGGVISLANGGTGASLLASNGGIVYSGAAAFNVLPGTPTANQVLLSGASTAPSWSAATYPSLAGASNNCLVSNGTNWNSAVCPSGSGTGIINRTENLTLDDARATVGVPVNVVVGSSSTIQFPSGADSSVTFAFFTSRSIDVTADMILEIQYAPDSAPGTTNNKVNLKTRFKDQNNATTALTSADTLTLANNTNRTLFTGTNCKIPANSLTVGDWVEFEIYRDTTVANNAAVGLDVAQVTLKYSRLP